MIKKYILRFNQSNPDSVFSFNVLRNGSKKIETRAASERYKKLRVGDELVFVCGKNKFQRKIKKITFFKSIAGMLKVYRVKDIMPDRNTKKDLEKAYHSYPSYKGKIKKHGLIALELK